MKVLFVCLGNTFRSPVAEALLKKVNPGVEVDSAGTNPASTISSAAVEYLLREKAVEYLKNTPQSLSLKNLSSYDIIVAMEQFHKEAVLHSCPECKEKVVVWDVADPYFLPHGSTEKIFDELKEKVRVLSESLQNDTLGKLV